MKIVVVTLVAITIFLPTSISAKKSRSTTKQEIRKFKEFIKIMDENYIDTLDYNFLIEMAIKSILDHTDPYSQYLKSEEGDQLHEIIESSAIDTAYMVNDTTACIKVGVFSKDASIEILNTYTELGQPNYLIIDLRGNKGGLLLEAIECSSLFLKEGSTIFHRTKRHQSATTYKSKNDGQLLNTNLIIIIDRESASASEILAAALQQNDRAVIAGERSSGKGLIIKPFTLRDGSVALISTSQYTTPNGDVIQRSYRGRKSSNEDGGIIPDIKYNSNEPIDNEDFIIFITNEANI